MYLHNAMSGNLHNVMSCERRGYTESEQGCGEEDGGVEEEEEKEHKTRNRPIDEWVLGNRWIIEPVLKVMRGEYNRKVRHFCMCCCCYCCFL